ncbi:hypothetical protein SAMN05216207_104641 [Pseudonocardia ammonioxydans]|uniref:Uncharacterized protein n=1 Tax=Pseudonocardia ammonioxydans TaxID=260086 RepID=A0A1I5GG90_PSUAM|nr:hypothetical protein [Pseudonocardia ammonioxydans]SFO35034.1 hypothetical protein SAMN05216207_104641 [Pseudonocardia ammonioxydans]
MTVLVALQVWAQIVGPVIAAVAAGASWMSAKASLRTAGRADQTAARAAEALSRVTRPELNYIAISPRGARVTSSPFVADLVLRNDSPHSGYVSAVRVVRRSDGVVLAEASGLDVPILTTPEHTYVPIGRMTAAFPDGDRSGWPTDEPPIMCTVEFTDAARLARWRQSAYSNEGRDVDERVGGGTVVFTYSDARQAYEPVPAGVDPDARRPRRGRLRLAYAALRGRLD